MSESVSVNLNERPPFPEVWDNTMLATGADCTMQMKYKFFHNLRPNVNNINLHAGGAFAKGLEVVRMHKFTPGMEHRSPDAPKIFGARALISAYGDVDPGDNVKSCDRMLGALESYLTQYNPDTDHIKPAIINGKPAVEFNFAWPIDVSHPVTGMPLIYCGRFDLLGHLNDDMDSMWVVDEKTTKQLGPTWPKQWTLRSQFMGYTWGSRKFGYNVKGAIIRGISILKSSYGHAEAMVYFPDWMVDRWYEQACARLERYKRMWHGDEPWEYNFASACTQYGGCQFKMLCESPEPSAWVPTYYKVDKWDPMKLKPEGEE